MYVTTKIGFATKTFPECFLLDRTKASNVTEYLTRKVFLENKMEKIGTKSKYSYLPNRLIVIDSLGSQC